MASDILWICISVPLTVVVTAIVNWILNRPKKIKAQRELEARERQELKDKQEEMMKALTQLCKDQDAEHKVVAAEREEILHKLNDIQEGNHLLRKGVQILLKNELKLRYEYWLKKGYAPVDAKDDLEIMYQVYHTLGQNGVLTSTHDRFLQLPNERVVKKDKTAVEDDNC